MVFFHALVDHHPIRRMVSIGHPRNVVGTLGTPPAPLPHGYSTSDLA